MYEDLTVCEYLDYFAHAYKMPETDIPGRVNQVIAQLDLGAKRDVLIPGLSRGMKQRLEIARAILHRPKLLLFGRAASGLDPRARLELRHPLRSLGGQGTTILISSHILTELEGFCTSIGIMERSRMARSGRLEETAGRPDCRNHRGRRGADDSRAPGRGGWRPRISPGANGLGLLISVIVVVAAAYIPNLRLSLLQGIYVDHPVEHDGHEFAAVRFALAFGGN